MMFFIPPAILAIEDEDDRSFMENLYRSYYRLMYHEIFTVTSDPWLAEDILQNVVISLIRNLSTIKKLSTARLVNYIKTASINTSYNYLRKNRKLAVSTFTDLNYIAEILDSEEKGPELLYLQKEDAQKFMVVFHELDAKDQYLLTSRFVEGKSYSSMATACAWLLLVQSAEPLNYLNRDTLMKNECLTPSTLTLNPPHQMSYEQKFGFSAY